MRATVSLTRLVATWHAPTSRLPVELHLTPCIVTNPPGVGAWCDALVNPANERLAGTRFTPHWHDMAGDMLGMGFRLGWFAVTMRCACFARPGILLEAGGVMRVHAYCHTTPGRGRFETEQESVLLSVESVDWSSLIAS